MEAEEIIGLLKKGDLEKAKDALSKEIDNLSDEELKEILEVAESVAKEKEDIELLKLVVYYYAEFFGIDKLEEFEGIAKEKGYEGLMHLADLYSLLGYPEKALDIYRELLKTDLIKEKEHIGEIYYGIATIHDELQEYDKALEAINEAVKAFKESNNVEKLHQAEVYRAYITFENGDRDKAKEILAGLLPHVTNREIKPRYTSFLKRFLKMRKTMRPQSRNPSIP